MSTTHLRIGSREIEVELHSSIYDSIARQENIAADMIAPLLSFADKLAQSVWLKSADRVTYLKASPFEYYPVVKIEAYRGSHVRYFAHGSDIGWWLIGSQEEWFAGTRPPVGDEVGTVGTSRGVEVAIHRNAIEIIEEGLAA